MRISVGIVGGILGVLAAAAMLPAQGATAPFDPLVDAVLKNGHDSAVPPHLTVMLGLSAVEKTTPVKQAVMRVGSEVRVFEVSTANHKDLVILHANEQDKSTKAYLLSADGKLRKAIAYQTDGPTRELSKKEAGGTFAGEVKYWMNVMNMGHGATPAR